MQAKGETVIVSIETAPGIFLAASEWLEKSPGMGPFKLPQVPPKWKTNPPRVHVLPLMKEVTVKNGNGATLIDRVQKVNEAVRSAFLAIGCEVLDGAPSRFERKDVI